MKHYMDNFSNEPIDKEKLGIQKQAVFPPIFKQTTVLINFLCFSLMHYFERNRHCSAPVFTIVFKDVYF